MIGRARKKDGFGIGGVKRHEILRTDECYYVNWGSLNLWACTYEDKTTIGRKTTRFELQMTEFLFRTILGSVQFSLRSVHRTCVHEAIALLCSILLLPAQA